MRRQVVHTSNVLRLMNAIGRLMDDTRADERMGLLHGRPGEGKTTSISYAVTQLRGVYLRASVAWTVTSMFQAICRELMLDTSRQRAPMLEAITESLAADPRPVFIDEADYLVRSGRSSTDMLDALRDIYDLAQVPVILVGMEDIVHKLKPIGATRGGRATIIKSGNFARFQRRITEVIEFKGITESDAHKVALELCEVEVEDTLLRALFQQADGNIDRLVNSLDGLERFARTNDLDVVTLSHWERRVGA
ncbi:MAG: ATP-binding protein [Bacteroidota bacterium]